MPVINLISESSVKTEAIAEQVGKRLKGGEVIELSSDLGGGKTTFARGLAKGLGYVGKVTSPTFTVSNVYESGEKTIYHYDFYRLDDAGVLAMDLSEGFEDPKVITLIEWSGIVDSILPEHVVIEFKPIADNERQISINYPKNQAYLVESLAS